MVKTAQMLTLKLFTFVKIWRICTFQKQELQILVNLQLLFPINMELNLLFCEALSELFQWLPHLHTLDVSSSAEVDDSVLKSLSNHCPALRLLNIGKCPGYTDQGLLHVSQNCYFLSVLDISYTKVTNQSIKFIAEGCFRSILAELHIDGCQFLTAECGNYLSQLSRVSMLSFYDCPSLLESDWFQR